MATITEQQSTMKSVTLTTMQEKRFPLVHILTSKPEQDDEKVRSCLSLAEEENHWFLRLERRTIPFREDHQISQWSSFSKKKSEW